MHVGAAWLSSARAVRCRLKCHNERNPFRRLPSGDAGDSGGTAAARREEGGDDVKSARPLRPGPHTCYNGGHSELEQGDLLRIMKSPPSSDRSLQPDSAKPDSLVIAHQPWRGEYVPRLEHLLSGERQALLRQGFVNVAMSQCRNVGMTKFRNSDMSKKKRKKE